MKNELIIKRIFLRWDFKLVTPFAINKESLSNFSMFDENLSPIIQSQTIVSAFHNFIPSPTKNNLNNIIFYDAPFFTYKIELIKKRNREILVIDKNSVGSIYMQITIRKKNIFTINGKRKFVNAKNSENMLFEYIRKIKKGIKEHLVKIGSYKKLNLGIIDIIDVHQKVFDKNNANDYLSFNREGWKPYGRNKKSA